MNAQVDAYFTDGCGRCEYYQTPQCKVHNFVEPMLVLRDWINETSLKEEFKWRQPCYTLNGKNVLILTAFKDYCCIAFFKGTLMRDSHQILVSPGKDSQATRQVRFTNLKEVIEQEQAIRDYITQAIELEASGAKVNFKAKDELAFPEEFHLKMEQDPEFKMAFEALTPGRKRSYNLYYNAAKQSSTRTSRIEKSKQKVLLGKGWSEY